MGGYKNLKARLGLRRVRPWRWTPFANPARKVWRCLYLILHYNSVSVLFRTLCNLTIGEGWKTKDANINSLVSIRFLFYIFVEATRFDRLSFSGFGNAVVYPGGI